MPPKKGPKASRLCDSIPSNTEIPDRKDPIRVLQEIGRGGFARIYKAEIKVCFLSLGSLFVEFLVDT